MARLTYQQRKAAIPLNQRSMYDDICARGQAFDFWFGLTCMIILPFGFVVCVAIFGVTP